MAFTISQAITINAAVPIVWKALTTPDQVLQRDKAIVAFHGDPLAYPVAGKTFRWTYVLGPFHLALYETQETIVTQKIYVATCRMSILYWKESYELTSHPQVCQLVLKLMMSCRASIFTPLLEAMFVKNMAASQIQQTLKGLKSFCENTSS